MVITTIRDDLGFFNETKARRLSKNTLKKYAQKFHNFKCWIKERPALKAQCFDHDGTNFYLQNVDGETLKAYIGHMSVYQKETKKKKKGSLKSLSTPEGYDAAIKPYYSENKIPLPQDYVEVLEHFKIGNSKRALIFYDSIT